LGVSKNLGDALTYEILTDDKATVLSRSSVRTTEEKMKQNLRVDFNHNLDPTVQLDPDTHHLEMPLKTSLTQTKVKTRHKRLYKPHEVVQQSQPIPTTTTAVLSDVLGEEVQLMAPPAVLRRSRHTRKHKTTAIEPTLGETTPVLSPTMPILGEAIPVPVATVSDLVPPTTICLMTGESTTPKDHGNPHLVSGGPTIVLDDENEPPLSSPRRRSSRIMKKRSILSILATALSMMGGDHVH